MVREELMKIWTPIAHLETKQNKEVLGWKPGWFHKITGFNNLLNEWAKKISIWIVEQDVLAYITEIAGQKMRLEQLKMSF